MQWGQILILVGFIFLGLTVTAVCVYDFQMKEYEKRIKKYLESIDVLIVQKYDLLRRISKIFKQCDISVPKEFVLDVRPKFEETLKDISAQERAIIKSFLMRTAQALFYYGEVNQKLADHQAYRALKVSYAETDHQYRSIVNFYNADAIGYNYWIRIGWFRWVAKYRKLTKKDIIS